MSIQERTERRLQAAELAISTHTDAVSRDVFTDNDPGMNLSQLLTSLQLYAKEHGINFAAALEGDDERLYDVEQASVPHAP